METDRTSELTFLTFFHTINKQPFHNFAEGALPGPADGSDTGVIVYRLLITPFISHPDLAGSELERFYCFSGAYEPVAGS